MENVIRLGDSTSHGGKVLTSGASHFRVKGIAVACVNDLCSCPIRGHDGCRIAPNNRPHSIGGVQVAFDGDLTTCGAKLISSTRDFHIS